jgi:hypothetical protein
MPKPVSHPDPERGQRLDVDSGEREADAVL